MTTTHNNIEIEWSFDEMVESHGNGAEWSVVGKVNDGKNYQGTCFGSIRHPEDSNTGEVLNIEEI